MFKNVTKVDLVGVLKEIGEEVDENAKVFELKEILLNSEEYKKDKDFITEFLATTVAERKKEEDLNRLRLRQQASENKDAAPPCAEKPESLDKILKAVETLTIPVPKKNETWHLFFHSLERAFNHKNVKNEYKSEILLKLIGEKAGNILVYIDENELKDYSKVKSLIIKEYEPSPSVCLDNFKKSKRLPGETHQQFATRLRSAFLHYCKIREVDEFQSLVNLIISDKMFETLDNEVSAHVAVRQGENWLEPGELARECDVYFHAKGRSFEETHFEKRSVYHEPVNQKKYIPPPLRKPQHSYENRVSSRVRECYICCSNFHLAKDCPNRRVKYEGNKSNDETLSKARINSNEPNDISAVVNNVNFKHLQCSDIPNEICLYPLQKVPIFIAGKEVECIIDSGTEISILNTSLIPDLPIEVKGKIILESAFSEQIEAKLAIIPVHYKNPTDLKFYTSNVLFALTDKLKTECLLTPDVYNSLTQIPESDGSQNCENAEIEITTEKQEETADTCISGDEKFGPRGERSGEIGECSVFLSKIRSMNVNGQVILGEEKESEKGESFSESQLFKRSQETCLTLKNAFKDASLGKNNYFLRDDLLFHKEKICGDTVYQLVLPKSYRDKVLKLSHKDNHLGMRKTKERIKLSFYWPNISRDIEDYCRTCEHSQLKSRDRQSDKINITSVVKEPYPFHTVNVDLIGEIAPPSRRKYKCCSRLIDQNSRWQEVVPLKNLSAKTTCDVLLETSMCTGNTGMIGSDQGGPDGNNTLSSKSSSEEDRKLFIGGISREANQKDLKDYFSKFGEVTEVNIKTNPTSGRSRGFAFVAFANRESVDSVLHNGPHTIKGKRIEAKRAKVRPGIKKLFVGDMAGRERGRGGPVGGWCENYGTRGYGDYGGYGQNSYSGRCGDQQPPAPGQFYHHNEHF